MSKEDSPPTSPSPCSREAGHTVVFVGHDLWHEEYFDKIISARDGLPDRARIEGEGNGWDWFGCEGPLQMVHACVLEGLTGVESRAPRAKPF